jgi:glycosyltransferase involved in cell wall biosynthesis
MRIFLASVHPPFAGGSANSSQELAVGLRNLGHEVLQVAPYNTAQQPASYPGLQWFQAAFPSGLTVPATVRAEMDRQFQQAYRTHGPFDHVILGRESFLWHLPALRQVHRGPISLICRGAYINSLASDPAIASSVREQLLGYYRACDLIVCIAQHLVTSIHRVVGVSNTIFLPNPIYLPVLNAEDGYRPQAGDPIRLFMAAQLKPRKRPLDAIEIMHLLQTASVDAFLTICGEGVDRPQVEAQIQQYGLQDRVSLLGKVDRAEVLKQLQMAETVLLCSDHEGRPRVLQEAIAAGRGVVAYDNPGSREVLQNWVTPWAMGRLVAIGDRGAASQAILDLAQAWRSPTVDVEPPQLPSPVEVLKTYETVLKNLLDPALSVAS